MLIPNHMPTLGSGTSSLRTEVFRVHRPAIKGKYRSSVPTALSLLVSIVEQKHSIELSDNEMLNSHSMDAQTRTHEIPERPTAMDNFITLNSKYSPRYNSGTTCSCIRSHRTEDIAVREDEDGIRSHFCPLRKEWDGFRDENEDYPDEPMRLNFDVDHFIESCRLKSEEIQCLMAEMPTLSESEDVNAISDVDATTSTIYLTQNRQSMAMEDSVTLEDLCKHKTKYFPAQRKLDEKTMSSWAEESSDDSEYCISDKETELPGQKCGSGGESDMEEFEENPEKENNSEVLKHHSDFEDEDKSSSDMPRLNEISNISTTDKAEYTDENSNIISNQDTDLNKGIREEKSDENELEEDDIWKGNSETHNRSQSPNGQGENNDTAQTEVEYTLPNPVRLCASKEDQTLQNPSTESSERNLFVETGAPEGHVSDDTKFETVDKTNDSPTVDSNTLSDVTDSSKSGENDPKSKPESKAQNISLEGNAVKEDKRDNLAMEPVDMHSPKDSRDEETQPDLATALRFMTEIYRTKDEEELYSDTLSNLDLPSEVPKIEKSAESVISRNFEDIQLDQTTGRPVDATSPSKSNPFETVLTEDTGTGKRSRNKFSKFFKSFKRKLAKKV